MKINKKIMAILLGLLVVAGNAFCDNIILSASADSTAVGADPTNPYGSLTFMRFRWQADGWGQYYPLIKFDLTGLSSNIVVNYARFAFWTHTQDDSNPYWPADNDFPLLSMYNNLSDWVEATVTYDNRPAIDPTAVDTCDHFDGPDDFFVSPNTIVSNKSGWTFYDGDGAATLVANWVNGVTPNYGVSLSGTGDYTDSSRYFDLISREDTTPAVRPYLYVDYTAIPEPITFGLIGCLIAMFIARKS